MRVEREERGETRETREREREREREAERRAYLDCSRGWGFDHFVRAATEEAMTSRTLIFYANIQAEMLVTLNIC